MGLLWPWSTFVDFFTHAITQYSLLLFRLTRPCGSLIPPFFFRYRYESSRFIIHGTKLGDELMQQGGEWSDVMWDGMGWDKWSLVVGRDDVRHTEEVLGCVCSSDVLYYCYEVCLGEYSSVLSFWRGRSWTRGGICIHRVSALDE